MATDDEFLQVTLPALDLVHNLARRFGRGRADAEDLVQDTYLRAWRATGSEEAALAESTRAHLAYNLVIAAIVIVALATGSA